MIIRLGIELDRDAAAQVASRLIAGEPCGDEGRQLGNLLAACLAGRRVSEAQRNAALRRAAEFLLPDAGPGVQAAAVRAAIRRYLPRWERVDRFRSQMPAAYAGALDGALFDALQAGRGKVPLSDKQLRRILAK